MQNDRLPISPRLFLIICVALLVTAGGVHLSALVLDTTTAQPPAKLAVSEGGFADQVILTWLAVDGADKYRVYRDGRSVKAVDGIRFRDADAEAGAVNAPVITEVNRRDDSLRLSWSEPQAGPGVRHAYSITAIVDGEESHHSPVLIGYRDAPAIIGYQLQIDDGEWIDVDDEFSVVDDTVDHPKLQAGKLSATDGDHLGGVALQLEGTTIEPGEASTYRVRTVTEQGVGEPSEPVQSRAEAEVKRVRWQRADAEDGEFVDIGETREGLFFDADDSGNAAPYYYRAVVETRCGLSDTTDVVEGYPKIFPDCRFAAEEPKMLPKMPFAAHSPEEIAQLMRTNAEACLGERAARQYQRVEVLGDQRLDDDTVHRVALIRAGLPGATLAEGRLYSVVQTREGWFVFRLMDYFASSHGSGGGTDRKTLFVDVERSDLGLGDRPDMVLYFHQSGHHYFSTPLGMVPEGEVPESRDPVRTDKVFAAVMSVDGGTPRLRGVARMYCRETPDDTGGVMHSIEPFDISRFNIGPGDDDTIRVQSPTKSAQVKLEMPEENPSYRNGCGE